MRLVLFFWLLSGLLGLGATLGAVPAIAQVPAAGASVVVRPRLVALTDSAAEAARADTAIAVQRLFAAKRRQGRKGLFFKGLAAGLFSYSLVTARPETTYQRVSTVGLGLVVAYYAAPLVALLPRQLRYRPAREQRVLDALEQGQPLPRRLRKQLKPAYFGVKTDNGPR